MGKQWHIENARDLPFCEAFRVSERLPHPTSQVYITAGASDCPPEKFDAIDPKKLAAELKTDTVLLGPRRRWAFDEASASDVGDTVDFDGVKFMWIAFMQTSFLRDGTTHPFTSMQIWRRARYLYRAGSTVLLIHPHPVAYEEVYVLQSYADHDYQTLTVASLADMGAKLILPEFWTYEVRKLDKDLTIESDYGVERSIQDNLKNVYLRCGVDKGRCSYWR